LIGAFLGALMIFYTVPKILKDNAREKGIDLGIPSVRDGS